MSHFKAKMHQIRFRLGLCPKPHWGDYSAPPDPVAGLRGLPLRGGEGKGEGEEEGKELPHLCRGGDKRPCITLHYE